MTAEPKIEVFEVSNTSRLDACAEEAATKLFFVPLNVEGSDEPIFASTLPTMTKLAKQQGLAFGVYPTESPPQFLEQRSIDWFAPAIFISSLFYTQNPHAVSVALSMLANYLTAIFPGRNDVGARLDVYYRDDNRKVTTKIRYSGPVSGLSEIDATIHAVVNGKKS